MTTQHRLVAVLIAGATFLLPSQANAHFQMLIPDDDMVSQKESRTINVDVRFWHPLEGHGMNMALPAKFGVYVDGHAQDLLSSLSPKKTEDHNGEKRDTFVASYTFKQPGDHVFYVEPAPYWEPSEETFIVHYTKVVVNAFGMEQGWDAEVGLKTEIVPLTRPYGLWTGNVFQGVVKVNGKPAPNSQVEIEYYNQDGSVNPPADPMITQIVKSDSNGIFTYAMPWAGWWGFAALHHDEKKMKRDGKDYPVEIGALLWVKTYDRR